MKLVAIGRPRDGADAQEIGRYARAEMRALWQLYRAGWCGRCTHQAGQERS